MTKLGRLTALGIREPWQAAFYLPERWVDYSTVARSLDTIRRAPADARVCVIGRIAGDPSVRYDDGPPRVVARIALDDGHRIGFTLFGNTKQHASRLAASKEVALAGEPRWIGGAWWLRNAEFVPVRWLGRLCPVYAGQRGVIKPATVRDRIADLLPEVLDDACAWLEAHVPEMRPYTDLRRIVLEAHHPPNVLRGMRAQRWLMRANAAYVAQEVRKIVQARRGEPRFRITLKPDLVERLATALPFVLTGDQWRAVYEILRDMESGTMRRVLSGDVGTGKTPTYGLVAAYVAHEGGRVAIMMPNQTLARQAHEALSSWWPEIAPVLITGNGRIRDIAGARVVVGTTALLFRPELDPDLMIVDEQQKFSREQRERLVRPGVHLLEVSATCIPRTQALVHYGALAVSMLRTGHANKRIHTRIATAKDRMQLFHEIKQRVEAGDRVLVIYPRRGDEEEAAEEDRLPSAEEAFALWRKHFGDRVRLAHGGMDGSEAHAAVKDVAEGRASILVATTVVEVGVNIPRLRMCVVVHAERFGLTTLHQIRGRLCREGGEGWFVLYLPRAPRDEKVLHRLEVLVKTNDGFEVAEADMRLRGFGDLSPDGEKQTGDGTGFLIGRPVDIDALEEVLRG